LLQYDKAQAIIQASWNWPFNRKDMDVYGVDGYAKALNHSDALITTDSSEEKLETPSLRHPHNSSLAYLAAVVTGKFQPTGLSSLENNMIVTEILTAARRSAKSGKTIYFRD